MASTVIKYNGYTLPLTINKFKLSESYTKLNFSCAFLVTAATEALFVAACTAAETALSVWNGDLELKLGATTEYTFSHDANTGFLAQPTLAIIPDKTHTGRSRTYSFSLSCDLPARDTGYNYRQSGNIALSQDIKGRKILTITGKYTAGGSDSAKDNYDDHAKTWADGIAAGFGTFEETSKNFSYEQENKILNFRFSYQEKLTLAVTYNSYSIPGSYNNFTFSEGYNALSMSFDFAIAPASASAAEVALRVKNKDLAVSFGGSAVYSYGHAANTGFLATPTLRKISNKTENDALRHYNFSLVCQLPANDAGYGYRRDANIAVQKSGSRRKSVNFSGTYTAGGANSAQANYEAGKTAFFSTWLTALGGTFEIISESISPEMENKLVRFTATYQELLTKDSKASTNVASIVGANCNYSLKINNEIGTSSSFVQIPLLEVNLNYSAQISRDEVSTDTGIASIYQDTVRPWLMEHSYDILGLGTFGATTSNYVIQHENYAIDPHSYNVSGTISFWALSSSSQIISLSETITEQNNEGVAYAKLFDGKPNTYNLWYLGAESKQSRSVRVVQVGSPPGRPQKLRAPWVRLHDNLTYSAKRHGVGSKSVGGQNVPVWLYEYQYNEEYLLSESGGTVSTVGLVFTDPYASIGGQ